MNVEILTLCESAHEKNGSLNIHRTFDSWEGKHFPVSLPKFCIAVRIRLPRNDPFGRCLILMLDPDGELTFKPTEFNVVGPVSNFIFINTNVSLKKAGVYHLVLREKESVISSVPLFVNKVLSPTEIPAASLN